MEIENKIKIKQTNYILSHASHIISDLNLITERIGLIADLES